jgi:hypothetical protein
MKNRHQKNQIKLNYEKGGERCQEAMGIVQV